PPGPGAVGQLAEGPPDRALPDPLRAADLPEEPLPQARADEARRVPREGHQAADQADARARHLEEAGALTAPPAAACRAGRDARGRSGVLPGARTVRYLTF